MRFFKYINTIPTFPIVNGEPSTFQSGDDIKVRKGNGSTVAYYWENYKVTANGSISFISGLTEEQNTKLTNLPTLEQYNEDLADKVPFESGKSLVDDNQISKLQSLDTQAQTDTKIAQATAIAGGAPYPIVGTTLPQSPTVTNLPSRATATIYGDTTGRTFTQTGGSSISVSANKGRTISYDATTNLWTAGLEFDLPKGSDGANLLAPWVSGQAYPINTEVRKVIDGKNVSYVNDVAGNTSDPELLQGWSKLNDIEVSNVKSRNEEEAAGIELFTRTIDGGWDSEIDLTSTRLANSYRTTTGNLNANISTASQEDGRGYIEIPLSIGGEYFFIQANVQGSNPANQVPLFFFSTFDNRVSILATGNMNLNTLENGILIKTQNPLGTTAKLTINTRNINDARFKVLKVTGVYDGIETRLKAQENISVQNSATLNKVNSSLIIQEGDIANGNYTLSDGVPDASTGILDADTNYKTTALLPVIAGNNYRAMQYFNATVAYISTFTNAYYNKEGGFVSRSTQTSTAPVDGFVRITMTNAQAANFTAARFAMVLNADNQTKFVQTGSKIFGGVRTALGNNTFLGLNNLLPEILRYCYLGKKLMVIGDSGTENYDAIGAGNHARMLRDRFGFASAYRMCRFGQSYCQLDTILAHSLTLPYLNLPSEAEISNVDISVFILGQNSRSNNGAVPGSGNPIGNIDDVPSIDPATSTIYGQIKYWVEWLLGKNPKMKIFLCSTWRSYVDNNTGDNSGVIPRLRQIAEATKNVAALYAMPYVPIFEECWSYYNYQQYMAMPDRLHFSYRTTDINGITGVQQIFRIISHKMQI